MSKSIYNKALDNLTWLLHDEFDENPKRSRLNVSQRLDLFKKVKGALEQAQKQEELSEELVNRDTPLKPLLVEVSADNEHHYVCSFCNATINIGGTIGYNKVFNVFCRECGQKLCW